MSDAHVNPAIPNGHKESWQQEVCSGMLVVRSQLWTMAIVAPWCLHCRQTSQSLVICKSTQHVSDQNTAFPETKPLRLQS